jgi:fructose/tagatose bisphosphate aldolase
MPLEAIGTLLAKARAGGYAVGYFESWSLASLQGVLDAVEEARAPVVLGWNGHFLSLEHRGAPERLSLYAALGRAAAETASVPCGLIFNECPRDDWTREAIQLGFNLVMPAPGSDKPERYVRRVVELTRLAHQAGVAVEGEVGELPGFGGRNIPTEPEEAAAFVAATGVDVLAVSVGNVHVLLQGETGLDLDRLEAIHRRLPDVPLVLHGGSGITQGAFKGAIERGVAKVNFGTYLKQRYLQRLAEALPLDVYAASLEDPHHVLGLAGSDDLLDVERWSVKSAVEARLDWLGCRGRA